MFFLKNKRFNKSLKILIILFSFLIIFTSIISAAGISLGASKSEVIKVLGEPDSLSSNTWWYGSSRISFRNGKVDSYSQGSVDLKIKLKVSNDRVPEFINLESNKEDVIKILGAPNSLSSNTWWYGSSRISFRNNKVNSYSKGSVDLKIKLIPKIEKDKKDILNIDLGSSKSEVLYILGEPDSLSSNTWWYGSSRISFRNDKVNSYSKGSVDLKISIDPNGEYLNPDDSYGVSNNYYSYNGKEYSIREEENKFSVNVYPISNTDSTKINNIEEDNLESYTIKDYYQNEYSSAAENGSYYGEISNETGRPKTVYVNGYFRKDGTYVRSHYRSKPK